MAQGGLLQRLKNGGTVLMAEGYVFEFERMGYLRAGAFVPEVVLEHPDRVRSLSEDFVHAGSDVVLAFLYYGHREKLRLIGKEDLLEKMNRKALQIAREVADKTGTLMAGNICNTTAYRDGSAENVKHVRAMFKEQVEWAVEYKPDFILAETFLEFGEAKLALEAIKKYGKGVPAVVNIMPLASGKTTDGVELAEACRRLEEAGADVVGVNCCRGPGTTLPLMKEIRKVCKGPIAAFPVGFRTTSSHPTMESLPDPHTGKMAFPHNLCCAMCSVEEVFDFAKKCKEIGVQMVGVCCGNTPAYTRAVAEAFGRTPPASRYSPNMSQHFLFGDQKLFKDSYYFEDMKGRFLAERK